MVQIRKSYGCLGCSQWTRRAEVRTVCCPIPFPRPHSQLCFWRRFEHPNLWLRWVFANLAGQSGFYSTAKTLWDWLWRLLTSNRSISRRFSENISNRLICTNGNSSNWQSIVRDSMHRVALEALGCWFAQLIVRDLRGNCSTIGTT